VLSKAELGMCAEASTRVSKPIPCRGVLGCAGACCAVLCCCKARVLCAEPCQCAAVGLQAMDEVWVPTQFNKDSFAAAGESPVTHRSWNCES
jgi:hypothetical protein